MRSSVVAGQVVVVGVDGTEDGERALRYGLTEARRKGHALRLVHAWRDSALAAPKMPHVPDPALRERAAETLFDAEREARGWGFKAAELASVLVRGSPVAALLENLSDASGVVLGTRPRQVGRPTGGSTTAGVAARAKVPVHCVPAAWDAADHQRRRVVVGVDGSGVTGEVVAGALAEARSRGAGLEVVHAWWPTDSYDASSLGGTLGGEWEEVARAALTRTVESVAGPAPDVRWTIKLYFQRPEPALVDSAADADLLVIGRRGRRGPLGPGLGTTARVLLREVGCPLVVLPVLHRTARAWEDESLWAAASA